MSSPLCGRCPQWLLRQRLPWLLLRGASHRSLEEPQPPQALAAAQKVAGAQGAGQRWLPEETQAHVRAEVTTEMASVARGQPLAFTSSEPGLGKRGVGWGRAGDLPFPPGQPTSNRDFFPQPQCGVCRRLVSNPRSASQMLCAVGQVT